MFAQNESFQFLRLEKSWNSATYPSAQSATTALIFARSPPAITIAWDKDVFILDIESTGALPIERLVHEAVKILDGKFESFIEELSVKKDETTQVAES